MDIATLIAKKDLFKLWVITPMAALLLLAASSNTFKIHKINALAQQDLLYNIIPNLEKTLAQADDVLSEFSAYNADGSEAGNELIGLLNEVAAAQNFELTSASVENSALDKQNNIQLMNAHIQGDGNLATIIKFMDEVLDQHPLLSEAAMNLIQTPGEPGIYSASFTFTRLIIENERTQK